jgi:hypothetical protein
MISFIQLSSHNKSSTNFIVIHMSNLIFLKNNFNYIKALTNELVFSPKWWKG